ncbi:EamA family transporter [Candidatus Daviesbacteria bacterium]|nr:EamA family transporter [Candidatus Daviesbacteria bacterium]
MNWLFFALLAPALYAVINFVDKYLLEKVIKDYRGMPVYTALSGLIVGTILWIVNGFPVLGVKDTVLVLLTGILSIFGFVLYYRALLLEQTSKIVILFQVTPVFVLTLSMFFLKETVSLKAALGFLLVLFAAINMASLGDKKSLKPSRAFLLVLICDLFIASAYVLFKFVSENNTFGQMISYESWGIFLGGAILYMVFPSIRKAFAINNSKIPVWGLGAVMVNESIYVGAKLFTYLAITLGSASIVSVLEGTQVFYGILYGFILTLIVPRVFKEDISKKGLIRIFILAFIAFLGIWLLS